VKKCTVEIGRYIRAPDIKAASVSQYSAKSMCEIKEGQKGVRPLQKYEGPMQVVICRDPGWSNKTSSMLTA